MYPVSSELYRQVAAFLAQAVGGRSYFSGSVEGETEGAAWRLTASVIVYRRRVSQPEGTAEPISDLVPVWWEFHLNDREGEQDTDFDWNLLNARLEERF